MEYYQIVFLLIVHILQSYIIEVPYAHRFHSSLYFLPAISAYHHLTGWLFHITIIGIFLPNKNSRNTTVPERLQDNINSGYAKLYEYPTYPHLELEKWIDEAYEQKEDGSKVDNSRKLYKYNRS